MKWLPLLLAMAGSMLLLTAQAQAQELATNPKYTVVVDATLWPHSTADRHFHLWFPKDTPVLKGLLVFAFHGGEQHFAENVKLRALAAELGCGVVGFDKYYMFPGHGEVPSSVLTNALTELARVATRPEVAHAPDKTSPPPGIVLFPFEQAFSPHFPHKTAIWE
jgi:poly(3-hydroxybutyrate) depolymerase